MQKAHSRRAQRLEESIMQALGSILIEDVQDPRLELVTITGVRLNKDLSVAEVLYIHAEGEEKKAEVQKAIEAAQGYLRTLLGQRLKLRRVPQLRFLWDNYLEDTIHAGPRRDR